MTTAHSEGIVWSRDFRKFINGLKILRSLDAHELPTIGVDWPEFRDDPYRYFMRCPDDMAAEIWRAIERRQPEDLRCA